MLRLLQTCVLQSLPRCVWVDTWLPSAASRSQETGCPRWQRGEADKGSMSLGIPSVLRQLASMRPKTKYTACLPMVVGQGATGVCMRSAKHVQEGCMNVVGLGWGAQLQMTDRTFYMPASWPRRGADREAG